MKKENSLYTGISEPEVVEAYLRELKHPLIDLARYLRAFILNTSRAIGEGIYWNGPTFFYTGKMTPFDPKEYKRYIVGFNFFKQDAIRLIFLRGALATDPKGLLTGEFKDKRKLMSFQSIEQVKKVETDFRLIIKDLIRRIDD